MNIGAGINNSDFPRVGAFRFTIVEIIYLSKVLKQGIALAHDNPLVDRARLAEILIEEDYFTLRARQLVKLLR